MTDTKEDFEQEIDELKRRRQIGPTGEFPDGQLLPGDEGELRIAIAAKRGNVIIAFGKDVGWLALGPAQAQEIAALLLQKAHEILNGGGR